MRLRLTPLCANGYNGPSGSWVAGTEKDVDDAEGLRLLGSFPAWFERCDAAPAADPEPETKKDRAYKGGRKK